MVLAAGNMGNTCHTYPPYCVFLILPDGASGLKHYSLWGRGERMEEMEGAESICEVDVHLYIDFLVHEYVYTFSFNNMLSTLLH